jgi:predicted RNase H-like HicB family nuclease
MAHDITIIISRGETLAENANATAAIPALVNQAVAAHDWWISAEDEDPLRETVHEWLEDVQAWLEGCVNATAALSTECPMK